MIRRLRILHLTPELPYEPGGGGGRTREFFLCRRLVELGHDVMNVSPVLPADRWRVRALEEVGVPVRVAVRPPRPIEEVARAVAAEPGVLGAALTQPQRALEMRVFWTRLRKVALDAVEEFRPDVVLVGHDMSMAWADDLPADIPAVLTCHNLLWNWYESRARLAHGPAALLLRAEAWRYRRFVASRLQRFHTAVAVSTIEYDQLVEMGAPRVALIPTGVDVETLRPLPESDGPPRVLFTGTMSYPPNSEGGAWLTDRVWPLVRAELSDARLDIVGKDPAPSLVQRDGRDGVAVVGFVPSMAPYFEAAHVIAVPILTGAGIRVKIIEALSAGRAVVSTSLGCEGLGLEPGRHLIVEDSAEGFAGALTSLLKDTEARERLSAEGRTRAERNFDWRELGRSLETVLAQAAADGASPGRGRSR
jgi:glycosyltransferase involved in cell wall biosynthesis